MLTKVTSSDCASSAAKLTQVISYRDQRKAIDTLCAAFGFRQHQVVTEPDGTIQYAHLTLGTGAIMLVPAQAAAEGRMFAHPDEIGGAETQACYFTVADIHRHYERAIALGAEIISPLQDMGYGGIGYTARDPEGHIWSFGTYDPHPPIASEPAPVAAAPPAEAPAPEEPIVQPEAGPDAETDSGYFGGSANVAELSSTEDPSGIKRGQPVLLYVVNMLVASVLAFTIYVQVWKPTNGRGDPLAMARAQTIVDTKTTMKRLQESVARERTLKDAAVAKAVVLEDQLRRSEAARDEGEQAAANFAASLRQHIQNLEVSLSTAEQSAKQARADMNAERAAKEEAVATAEALTQRLAVATEAQARAEATVQDMRVRLQKIETAMAESSSSTTSVSAELDNLKVAKAAVQVEVDSLQQALSEQRQAKEDESKKMDQAIAALRRQLGEEQKARETAEAAAAELRSQLEVAELAKAEAAREIAKIESQATTGEKVKTTVRRPQGYVAKRKRTTAVKAAAAAPSKVGAAPAQLPKLPGVAGPPNKPTTTVYADWETEFSAPVAPAPAKARGKKKELEVWEYTSPLWQENAAQ
ncbi:MAG: VOC family protein [Hyphomicrobium sp.]